jgi:hypothetical protein
MFALLSRIGENNAVVVSQKTLSKLLGYDDRTVRRAVAMLRENNWLETRSFGERGGVQAYIVNDRIAWHGERDGIRYSLFSATVLVSSDEQPDRDELGQQAALIPVPAMHPGEKQLVSGPGLPPPSEPGLPGLEPDLPAIDMADPDDVAALRSDFARRLGADPETGEVFE